MQSAVREYNTTLHLSRFQPIPALVLVLIYSLVFFCISHAATPRSLVAKVDRVSDGDSVIATTSDGTKLRIRLLGIDAPEVAQGSNLG